MGYLFWYFNKGPFSKTKQKQADDNRGLLHVTAVRSVWLELTPRDGAESSEANCPSHKATNTRCFQLVPKIKVRFFQFSVLCKFH